MDFTFYTIVDGWFVDAFDKRKTATHNIREDSGEFRLEFLKSFESIGCR